MKKFIFLAVLFFCCASSWTSYSVRYVSSEKELNEFIADNQYKYRVFVHEKEGLYEIHYKKVKDK